MGLYILRDAFHKGEKSLDNPFIRFLIDLLAKEVQDAEKQFILRLVPPGDKYRSEFGKKLASNVIMEMTAAEPLPLTPEAIQNTRKRLLNGANASETLLQRPIVLDPERGGFCIIVHGIKY